MEEYEMTPETYPCIFHNIDEEREETENSIALLKLDLENLKDTKILKSFLKFESSNEDKRRQRALKILSWTITHNCDASIIKRIHKIDVFYQDLPYMILESQAQKYFTDIYRLRPEQIIFVEKVNGVQLGRKILITLSSSESISYYIKTHRNGPKWDPWIKFETKSVDPKELLVYTALQYLELGPKVHYFWENSINFYIASSDLSQNGKFTEYRKICKSLPDPINTPNLDPKHLQISKELTKLDLFSRIFCLSDTIINKENFGFVEKDGSQFLFLIDFIVKDNNSYSLEGLPDCFLAGHGSLASYRDRDPTIWYSLQIRSADEKWNIAADFFNNYNVKEALQVGYRRASDIAISLGMSIKDLENYYKGVEKNIQQFEKIMYD